MTILENNNLKNLITVNNKLANYLRDTTKKISFEKSSGSIYKQKYELEDKVISYIFDYFMSFTNDNLNNDDKILIDKLIDQEISKFNNNDFANKYLLDKGKEINLSESITKIPIDIINRKNVKVPIYGLDVGEIININDITRLENSDLEQKKYEERYALNAVLTEYVSTKFTNSKTLLYLITTFNNKMKTLIPVEYKDHIFILYKGGNVMKNLFETIKDKNVLDENTVEFMDKYFKRSDFDFEATIVNYKDYNEYNTYYDYAIKLILFTVKSICTILQTYGYLFFNIEKEFKAHKENILEELNKKLEEIKFNNANVYNINKFTNIKISNNTTNNLFTYDESTTVNTKVDKILDIIISKNRNPYHYYLNDTVEIYKDGNKISFTLGRIKYTFNITYDSLNDTTRNIDLKSEILDLSMARYYDSKLLHYKKNNLAKEIINYYKKDEDLDNIEYESYSITTLLIDLIQQLEENKYIWLATKYEKKLNRFLFFINIKLSSDLGRTNYDILSSKFIEFMNSLDQSNSNKYKEIYNDLLNILNNLKMNETDIFQLFVKLIKIKYEDILNDTIENKALYDEFRDIILTFFNNNKYVNYKIPKNNIELTYLEKYIKYKTKYLKLKKS